jgi:hypothetical protein
MANRCAATAAAYTRLVAAHYTLCRGPLGGLVQAHAKAVLCEPCELLLERGYPRGVLTVEATVSDYSGVFASFDFISNEVAVDAPERCVATPSSDRDSREMIRESAES